MNTAADTAQTGIDNTTRFGAHLLQLVGEPFLFLSRGYGDELILHFGDRALGPVRMTKHGEFRYEHGTYSLHLRGSAWLIKAGASSVIFSAGMETDLTKAFGEPIGRANAVAECPIMPGARPTAMNPFLYTRPGVDGIGLRVELSDGSTLIVIPTPDEPEPTAGLPPDTTVFELADWELKTPHFTLQVGPGQKWHLKSESSAAAP